jgi:hypothetical protein
MMIWLEQGGEQKMMGLLSFNTIYHRNQII